MANLIIFTLLLQSFSFSGVAFAKAKNSAYQFYTAGTELAEKKKYVESVEKFDRAIELNPSFLASYLEGARSLVMLGKRGLAMKKLDEASKHVRRKEEREKLQRERALLSELFYTNNTFQSYQNGLNFLRLERPNAAVEALNVALSMEPDNVAILLAYAEALQAEENTKQSVQYLERALTLNPHKKEVRILLAEAELGIQPVRSLEILRQSVQGGGDERELIVFARALSLTDKNKQAIDLLQERVTKNSNWVLAQFWLGKFYSLEPQGNWMARKYLMTFLKRADQKHIPKAIKQEAEALLLRVNQALQ